MGSFTPARYPALRLLVPMAAGTALGCHHGTIVAAAAVAFTGLGLYLIISLNARTPDHALRLRPLWIVPIALLAFALGMASAIIHRPVELHTDALRGKPLEAQVIDVWPGDFSTTLTATLQVPGRPKIQLTTRGCDYTIAEGDFVRFTADLKPITNMGNPDETDYAALMWRKGIGYTQHITTTLFHYSKEPRPRFSFRALRHKLEDVILANVTDEPTQQLVIAMVLGDSRLIDDQMRDDFARAGIAHVLALSGLHLGLVAWLVWLVLMPLDYWHLRWLRLVLTMIAMAAFCAMTGASPSVVRASLMIGFSFIAFMAGRRYPPLNATAVAAMLILLFQPMEIYGIGFQLSFITVATLIVTLSHWQTKTASRVTAYFLATLVTSFTAMIATAMLTAYYFHTISFIAPIANVVTLPLVPIIIASGLVLLAASLMGVNVPAIAWLTQATCSLTERTAHALGSLPGGHIAGIYVGGPTLLFYYGALALTIWWVMHPRRRTALAAMAMTIGMVATHAIDAARTPEAGIVVFNDHSYTPIVAFDHGKALLWAPDIDSQPTELTQHFSQRHRAFLAHYGINHITATTGSDATCPPRMAVRPPLAWMCGKRIAAADRKSDIGMIFASNAKADIIVVGKHFNADALPATDSAVLVLSGARQKAMPVARGNVHDLASDGALVMLMDE